MTKQLAWADHAWQDYVGWQSHHKTLKRISNLIKDVHSWIYSLSRSAKAHVQRMFD